MGETWFVLGGARSGKSRFAEKLAASLGPSVVYIATLEPGDEEMEQRVRNHRAARPSAWTTIEAPLAVAEALQQAPPEASVLLDCLTLWTSNQLLAAEAHALDEATTRDVLLDGLRGLLEAQAARPGPLIAVSNEVGSGIVPAYPLGRQFRDLLGEVNQQVAAASSRLYYLVAGHFIDLKALGARPIDAFRADE